MSVKVITTMSQEYWDKVGQYSVTTWPGLLPEGWKLWLHETPAIPLRSHFQVNSPDKEKWFEEAAIEASKRPEPYGYQKEWKTFSHKSFAQWEIYKNEPSGIMMWCDSDVKWKKQPTEEFLNKCLEGKFCAFLGRDRVDTSQTAKHQYKRLPNETCILVYNLDHPVAKTFFTHFEDIYKSFKLFDHYDWSDCGAFEMAMMLTGKEHFNDLTKDNPPAINPLPLSILDEYFEHWMGWSNKEARDDVSGKKEKAKILKRNRK